MYTSTELPLSALSFSKASFPLLASFHRAFSQLSRLVIDDNSYLSYFENVVRFAKAGFVPNGEDMLRARIKTTGPQTSNESPPLPVLIFVFTGIREVEFNISDRNFLICDVGGQRSERRKWIHCFDNVNAIIYLVPALSFIP